AGLPRNPELPAQGSHTLPILEPNYETHSFVHDRTFLPRHPHFRPHAGEKCNPCLRNVLLPMSRVGHNLETPTKPVTPITPFKPPSLQLLVFSPPPCVGLNRTSCRHQSWPPGRGPTDRPPLWDRCRPGARGSRGCAASPGN